MNAPALKRLVRSPLSIGLAYCVAGEVVEIRPNGQAIIDFPGNAFGPCLARSVVRIRRSEIPRGSSLPVLLAFEEQDERRPVILGVIADSLVDDETPQTQIAVTLDSRRLDLSAQQEIVLRCGQGSITLSADGRIVLKGTNLTSRASETNKIKGASVAIN